MTLFFFSKIPKTSKKIERKRGKKKLQFSAEFKLWSKDTMQMIYAKEENTLSPPTRSVDSSKTPHRSSLLLQAQHGYKTWGCVFASFLPLGLLYSFAPHPTVGGNSRGCPLGRLLAAGPLPLARAHCPRRSRTGALPPPPSQAALPTPAAATGWQVASQSASVR